MAEPLNNNVITEERVSKTHYDDALSRLISTTQAIRNGAPQRPVTSTEKEVLIALGINTLEAAGQTYLSDFLTLNDIQVTDGQEDQLLFSYLKASARNTVKNMLDEVLSDFTQKENWNKEALSEKVNMVMLTSAKTAIDRGIQTVQKSNIYFFRHLELEYALNDISNLRNSYISITGTQPLYQSTDLSHNILFQGGGLLNEQSVDVNDHVRRHTLNVGLAYRYLTQNQKYIVGGNIFYDHQWPYHHSRMSFGLDGKSENFNVAANYYIPLSSFKSGRNGFEEKTREGYDFELGYRVLRFHDLKVFGKGYQYFNESSDRDDLLGMKFSSEYKVFDRFTIKSSLIEENKEGNDRIEFSLQYDVPLYDIKEKDIVANNTKNTSISSRIFEKVRRENSIRIEERSIFEETIDPCLETPAIGTICSDGSVYAGLSPDDNAPMFVARCDAGMSWNGSSCTGVRGSYPFNDGTANYLDVPTVSNCGGTQSGCRTGQANSAGFFIADSATTTAGNEPHIAVEYCENLNEGGRSDWYLPSLAEIDIVYSNLVAPADPDNPTFADGAGGGNTDPPALDGVLAATFDTSGVFPTGWYWTSSEFNSSITWAFRFSDGSHFDGGAGNTFKNFLQRVRCVRK